MDIKINDIDVGLSGGCYSNHDEEIKKLSDESQKIVKDKKIYRRFLEKQYNRVSSLEELVCGLPDKNEQIRVVTQKAFNAFAVFLWIQEKVNVEEMLLTSYRIDLSTAMGIEKLVKSGNVKKVTLVLSSFFTTARYKEPGAELLKNLACEDNRVTIFFCNNHTKILAVKTADSKYYVVEGSGNLTGNSRIEQYLIEQSKETYDFHEDWIKNLDKNLKTKLIKKFYCD